MKIIRLDHSTMSELVRRNPSLGIQIFPEYIYFLCQANHEQGYWEFDKEIALIPDTTVHRLIVGRLVEIRNDEAKVIFRLKFD